MDQDETTTPGAPGNPPELTDPVEPPTAGDAEVVAPDPTVDASSETERGPILGTLLIRVTLRDDPAGADDRPALPTNDAVAALVEAAFRAGGYAYVNASAEKV